MRPLTALFLLLLPAAASATDPLVHTYSIVARDAATGELGVAVQSHWFGVGTLVPWAQSGVGAVATQSFVRVEYGPQGLTRLAAGEAPEQALAALLEADPERDGRQVAMVDATGRVAAWTGPGCIREAGHQTGDGYSVQANLMENATVWPAMAAAFEQTSGDLASRMLAALDAAEGEGGDIRGRQSAALLVVRAETTGEPWRDRVFDLRVDDSPAPLEELRRLVERRRAYLAMDRATEAIGEGDSAAAETLFQSARALAPDLHEIAFWQGVTLAGAGSFAAALPAFADAYKADPRWREIAERVAEAGLLPKDPAKLALILDREKTDDDTEAAEKGRWIEGVLTDEGVECPAMRDFAEHLYTLTGDLHGLGPGTEVRILARPVQVSFCMQGTTIEILQIAPLD